MPPSGSLTREEEIGRMLMTMRVVWFALLCGQVIFGVIVLGHCSGRGVESYRRELVWPFGIAAAVMLAVAVPAGLFVRMQIYKRHWRGDVISPKGYFTGNLVFLAMCEGVSLFGLATVMIMGYVDWSIVVSVIAVLIQLANFPTGAPMRSPHAHLPM